MEIDIRTNGWPIRCEECKDMIPKDNKYTDLFIGVTSATLCTKCYRKFKELIANNKEEESITDTLVNDDYLDYARK